MATRSQQRGFTLVELIMVIVIMGVIGGIVSIFMKSPINAYFASARRAALTDAADTVVRRMARDVRKALPNTLRPLNASQCIEFIPTKTGGRYRESFGNSVAVVPPADTMLDFSAVDKSFFMLGDSAILPTDQQIAADDLIAVYNLGITGSDAYALDNIDRVVSAPAVPASGALGAETHITTAGRPSESPYPLESGSKRFHVIPAGQQVVRLACVDVGSVAGEGTGGLYRYVSKVLISSSGVRTSYATSAACPSVLSDLPTGAAMMANNVSACSFNYDATIQRNAIVQMTLGLTRSNETVRLYHEVHVDNTP